MSAVKRRLKKGFIYDPDHWETSDLDEGLIRAKDSAYSTQNTDHEKNPDAQCARVRQPPGRPAIFSSIAAVSSPVNPALS